MTHAVFIRALQVIDDEHFKTAVSGNVMSINVIL
jgi:hypothetical protein